MCVTEACASVGCLHKEQERSRAEPQDDHGASTAELEQWIDALDAELPPLRNFILPGGGLAAASLHVARSVCRRAERSIVPLVLDGECEDAASIYLNRLSDYLFVAARYVAVGEVTYQKPFAAR